MNLSSHTVPRSPSYCTSRRPSRALGPSTSLTAITQIVNMFKSIFTPICVSHNKRKNNNVSYRNQIALQHSSRLCKNFPHVWSHYHTNFSCCLWYYGLMPNYNNKSQMVYNKMYCKRRTVLTRYAVNQSRNSPYTVTAKNVAQSLTDCTAVRPQFNHRKVTPLLNFER